jgi:hypothetical protein
MTFGPEDPPRDSPNIVTLRTEPIVKEPPRKPTPLSRLHGIATVGMTLCAFVGIISLLALITVRWPGDSDRFATGALVGTVFGFMLCGSIAVFSAARDTYARRATPAQEQE